VNIRLACHIEVSSSDELVAARSHNAQPERFPRRIPDGVIRQHRTTTSELPFT
jgi:hypothetical protein